MELGRNIKEDNGRYYLVLQWAGETTQRQHSFDTYRKARLQMTKYLNSGADWFGAHSDPTI